MIEDKKILVLGLAKSGTTVIAHTIFNALPEDNRKMYHEPTGLGAKGFKQDKGKRNIRSRR